MKRIILLSITAILLVGCSQMGQWEKSVNGFMSDVKEMNIDESEQLSGFIKTDMNKKRKGLEDKLFETLSIDHELKNNEEYEEFVNKLRLLQKEMKYEIENIDVNEANTIAKVTVNFSYVDIGDEFESIVNNNLDKSVLKMSAGETPDSFIEDTLSSLNDELDKVNLEDSIVERKSVIVIKKAQSKFKVAELDNNLLNVISLGISDYLKNSFDAKLEEVKVNKVFLEVESNFNEIMNVLNDKVSDIKEIKGQKLSKEITKELGIETHIGGDGAKEGVYYIFERDGKVTIAVMIDKEMYTIKKKLEPKDKKSKSKKKTKKK